MLRRQFEAGELKARRDGAAHQRPVAERFGGLPGTCRHGCLRTFARCEIATQRHAFDTTRLRDFQRERRARIPMPNLDRVNAMPVRALAACKQEVDCGGCGAAALNVLHIAKGLAEMPALGMRFQIEKPNDVVGGKRLREAAHDQNLFLRSRISANTFHAGVPERPSDFANAASSARKKGLAAFSAPIVAGIVNS